MSDKVKTLRPYSPESFAFAARSYLERFPCSEARCARTLRMKFQKRRQPVEEAWIAEAVAMGKRAGFLDDDRYGEALLREYARQGLPPIRIKQKMQVKQLPSALITKLLATLPQDNETRREALATYARRKRLGPHNAKHPDPKDYGRLRRAGFGHSDVMALLNRKDDDEDI